MKSLPRWLLLYGVDDYKNFNNLFIMVYIGFHWKAHSSNFWPNLELAKITATCVGCPLALQVALFVQKI